jgi:hypothetical protein
MKLLFCSFLFLIHSIDGIAQASRDSVVAAVNKLFEGMIKADTSLLKDCFSSNALMQTIQDNNGIAKVVDEDIAGFISFVGKEAAGAADERIVVETVKINGSMAMVWAPYKFYYKGKLRHCGVNSFQLVRLPSGWKIQYILDTRTTSGCL